MTCKETEWTPSPKCMAPCTITKQKLEAKNLFLSGSQRHSRAVQNNQTLEFLCGEGYVLSAPSVRKCIDGHMDLPSCISESGKNCSRPPVIENGDITTLSQNQYTAGSSVQFKCQRFYAMEGQSRSFCDNGNWTEVPACLEPCIISMAEIERRNINVKQRSNEDEVQTLYILHGDSIEFNCKPGHGLATNPSQSVFEFQCRGELIVYPECKEIVCSRPEVNNGRVSPHLQRYSYEEAIQLQCDTAFEPEHRQAVSKCTTNGWLPVPKCVSKHCNYPEAENVVVYGYSERDKSFPKTEGDSIDIRCKDGFLPANKRTWQRSTCTRTGWDPEPKCFKLCEHKVPIPHGEFIYGYWAKFVEENEISFTCRRGYYPEQPEGKVKCTKNGWSPTPRCISRDPERRCGRPPVIQNGDVLNLVQASYLPGTILRYKCQNLYVMNGTAEVRCENGLWTETPTCIEVCTISEEDMSNNNIQLKWQNAPKLYSESGDVVEFVCKWRYHPDPASPPFRTQCINGRMEYPRCI